MMLMLMSVINSRGLKIVLWQLVGISKTNKLRMPLDGSKLVTCDNDFTTISITMVFMW